MGPRATVRRRPYAKHGKDVQCDGAREVMQANWRIVKASWDYHQFPKYSVKRSFVSSYLEYTMERSWNLNGIIVCQKQSTWTISKMQNEPLLPYSTAEMVHEAGLNASKVWALDDDIFCKSKLLIPGTTLEHVTLAYVQKHSRDFEVPNIHHHEEYNGRYYIISSRVSGPTLGKAWPTMDDANKDYYVRRVAEICTQMAGWEGGSTISGVDGLNLSERFLSAEIENITADDLNPSKILENCKDIGLECSPLVFYHCDLGPGNIIVDLEKKRIGIIDWESAGWVPIEWVRTKFRISSGMDLDDFKDEERVEWRKRVQLELGERGFPEAANKWATWRRCLRDQFDRLTAD